MSGLLVRVCLGAVCCVGCWGAGQPSFVSINIYTVPAGGQEAQARVWGAIRRVARVAPSCSPPLVALSFYYCRTAWVYCGPLFRSAFLHGPPHSWVASSSCIISLEVTGKMLWWLPTDVCRVNVIPLKLIGSPALSESHLGPAWLSSYPQCKFVGHAFCPV